MCAHRRQIRALLDGRRQTDRLAMGAMRRIDEQRHAVRMTNLRQLGDILQNTIVVRAGHQNGGRLRVLPQRMFHILRIKQSRHAVQRLRHDKHRCQIQQRHRVRDGFVTIPI